MKRLKFFAATAASALLMTAALPIGRLTPASAHTSAAPDSAHRMTRLRDYLPLTRTCPKHVNKNYRYSTNEPFWSAVATNPGTSSDVDLWLYADKAHTDALAISTEWFGINDLVVIDSAYRPMGEYYLQVRRGAGCYLTYDVELAQGDDELWDDDQDLTVEPGETVIVRDTYLHAGYHYNFGVSGAGAVGAVVYLFTDDPDDPDSWAQAGFEAAAHSDPEGFPIIAGYEAPTTGWYGLAVTLQGHGPMTLIRASDEAPGTEHAQK